jgi:outer membrane protein assembly factor BamB
MVLAGGKMWLVVRPNGDPIYILDAYDIHKTDQPVLQIDLTKEFKNTGSQSSTVYITTDTHVVWLSIEGKLYYFDLNTGQMLGSLSIGKHVMGMGFDGKSLWVLSNEDGLIQVSIPW